MNLADALQELGARLRVEGAPDGVPFDPHPTMLRDVAMMTLITEERPLDLCFVPAGSSGGYDSLSEHASVIVVGAVDVPAASLELLGRQGIEPEAYADIIAPIWISVLFG